jgi:hypothetical protein
MGEGKAGRKDFFFKKKKQKTFDYCATGGAQDNSAMVRQSVPKFCL